MTGEPVFTKSATRFFSRAASWTAKAVGKPATFAVCFALTLLWAAAGPVFHYSDGWQLVVNTGSTIFTWLTVILIQNTQNRDGAAVQGKLDEIIKIVGGNKALVRVEVEGTEEEIEAIRVEGEGQLSGSVSVTPRDTNG